MAVRTAAPCFGGQRRCPEGSDSVSTIVPCAIVIIMRLLINVDRGHHPVALGEAE